MKLLILLPLLLTSCLNTSDIQKINSEVELLKGHEIVEQLLDCNDGDVEQLARIFSTSVPVIQRIQNKESELTFSADQQWKDVLKKVKIEGSGVFYDLDPYYESRTRKVLYYIYEFWWIYPFLYLIPLLFFKEFFTLNLFVGSVLKDIILMITLLSLNWVFPYVSPIDLQSKTHDLKVERLLKR
ncbi:hypothetical protein KMW28_18810 [Flammeovirga yaeyamensis]|uniref:Lipoprotein n=1 Tax=Flammeovirga yaeyamensis TaxID=367791 RepID=A0AAX1N6M7_9BACT|nr:hypothetical protein [Flammeovirga yaeyamensis]MBB3701206.1 hypothetical protein [Flammeovirga yaeyamensis]NMF38468.1 hypothetical protein [Flammeovirga yaeyamensis]QWG01672.1 hypothetical protein KMW28_18810 [Flammeovirga yaeyamensis]